jgi:hypothetical protein
VDDPFSARLPASDCRRKNDEIVKPYTPISVVETRNLRLMWVKVGAGFDLGNLVADDHFNDIVELGGAYIQATYPVARTHQMVSPLPIIPPTTAVHDWMAALLSVVPWLDPNSLTPFVLVFELNLISIGAGYSDSPTIMGSSRPITVRKVEGGTTRGVSMALWRPRRSYPARKPDPDTGVSGPTVTLPAHELGHTFNLSVDSRLKDHFLCNFTFPVVGDLPCSAAGGLDEYKHHNDLLKDGNPANGFWVNQPNGPASVTADLQTQRSHTVQWLIMKSATHTAHGRGPRLRHSAQDAATIGPWKRRTGDYEHDRPARGWAVLTPLPWPVRDGLFVSAHIVE